MEPSDKTHIDLHFSVKAVVEKEVVGHADPVGLHGVALAIIVVPHIPLDENEPVYVTEIDRKPTATMHFDNFIPDPTLFHNFTNQDEPIINFPYIQVT